MQTDRLYKSDQFLYQILFKYFEYFFRKFKFELVKPKIKLK